MAERITEYLNDIPVHFVTLDEFGQEDLDNIARKWNLTVVWETQSFPMPPARMEKLLALPRSAYLAAWCVPLEVAATLEEFRDWMMARLRKPGNPWSSSKLRDATTLEGINETGDY